MKHFLPYQFDEQSGLLASHGRSIPLTRKAARLLALLLEHAGELVSHARILEAVWPDTHVQPDNIKALVHELRGALMDRQEEPVFIKSEAGRGYRFVADAADAPAPWPPDRSSAPTLIGRDADLTTIERHYLVAAERAEPQVVIVQGERGCGKTALCEAFGSRPHPGLRIAHAQGLHACRQVDAFSVLFDAFTAFARQYPAAIRTAATRCGLNWPLERQPGQPFIENDPGRAHQRMLLDAVALLHELAADVPLLIVLEDLQWADAATLDVLSLIGWRNTKSRLCILGTFAAETGSAQSDRVERTIRELETTSWCSLVELRPLTEPQLGALLSRRFGLQVARTLERPLYRAGGGSPAFAKVAIDHLARDGAIQSGPAGWKIDEATPAEAVPAEALRPAFQGQIDRLSSLDLDILSVAARSGPGFTAEEVAAAIGPGDLRVIDRRLTQLAAGHVLVEMDDRRGRQGLVGTFFRFRHQSVGGLLLDRRTRPSTAQIGNGLLTADFATPERVGRAR